MTRPNLTGYAIGTEVCLHRERLGWLRLGAVLTDAVALVGLWSAAVALRTGIHSWWPLDLVPGSTPVFQPVDPGVHLPLVGLVVPLWIASMWARGSYQALRRKDTGRILLEVVVAVGIGLAAMLATLFLLKQDLVSRTLLVGFSLASIPTLVSSRFLQRQLLGVLRRSHFDPHRVVLFGAAEGARPWLEALERHQAWGIAVVEVVDDPAALATLLVTQPIDEVHVASTPDPDALVEVARLCDELGVMLSLDANFLGLRTAHVRLDDYDGWSALTFSATPAGELELVLKRAIDVVGAALGLVLLSPVLAALSLAIKLQDGGPVLFVQERAGRYGRPFRMLKFRSMRVGAESQLAPLQARNEMSGPVFKLSEDPRITRLGRFLRHSSLDELPQLYNVLRGEMSLVGPRPHQLEEVRGYARWQLRRLSMRPGLTCIWQVSGRSNIDFDRWMALDLEYIDHFSLWLDLRLLVRTIPAVLSGEGAR